nr:hypothetical protein [Bacteroides clarus]
MVVQKSIINKSVIFILLLAALSSCIDEIHTHGIDVSSISVGGMELMNATHPGEADDNVVRSLRILSFERSTGNLTTNIRYNAWLGDIVHHAVSPGGYDFVFLANEPLHQDIVNTLNGIEKYADLDRIAYPAEYFSSEQIIPMIQELKNVTVLSGKKGIRLSDGTEFSVLELALDRLGVRVDVTVESADNFDETFNGIIFSNVPNSVPLTVGYSGPAIERTVIRAFTKNEDGNYFSDAVPVTEGANWAKKVNRIILPSSGLMEQDDKGKAVNFIIDMGDNYSPSCELQISKEPLDYRLPLNTKLDLTAIIKEPLEVNIKASEWDYIANDWEIAGNRMLNVSHTEVSITDFNGARISFWSNMPVVRVLETVKVRSSNRQEDTNVVFNALASQSWNVNNDERFLYNPQTGAGYMDILLDWPNEIGEETYEITLMAAEDYDGKNKLLKTVTVHVKQEGKRFDFIANSEKYPWSQPYVGAFYKNNETGERVISGLRYTYWHQWTAKVPDAYKDFIVLSSTPSFDPGIGTALPGDPEKYPVIPNEYRGETGDFVHGKGRIYFRIGLKSRNTDIDKPRYGVVELTYEGNDDSGNFLTYKTKVYVRQGEAPDYLMRNGSSGSSFGRKFSPYNLTAKAYKNNPGSIAEWYGVDISNLGNEVAFVDYPTQAGAHFQWGLAKGHTRLANRAYHPTNKNVSSGWSIPDWPKFYTDSPPLWDPATGFKYKDSLEICPPGYYRPTDGPINKIATNSFGYDQVYQSEWRMSLFNEPMKGDGSPTTVYQPIDPTVKTELYVPKILNEVMYGFYADGFFDRRPIKTEAMIDGLDRANGTVTRYKGVALNSADAAYGGTLIVNSATDASLFFPSAGRRWHDDGSLEFAGETGYYWSSSVAPGWVGKDNEGNTIGTPYANIWTMEFNYVATQAKSVINQFAHSIRCVKR